MGAITQNTPKAGYVKACDILDRDAEQITYQYCSPMVIIGCVYSPDRKKTIRGEWLL